MPIAVAHLRSLSPYSQSNYLFSKKQDNETDDDLERRAWRERIHTTKTGYACIPAAQFNAAIKAAATYLHHKVPGTGGKGTFRKHFDSGVFVYENLVLPLRADEVEGEWLMLPSNPNNTKSGKVPKCMPLIAAWDGMVTYTIYDQTITEPIFLETLRLSGIQIGIGRFRASQKGIYGRYEVVDMDWQKIL